MNKLFALLFTILFVFPFIGYAGDNGDDIKSPNTVLYDCEEDMIEIMFSENSEVRLRSGDLIDYKTNALQGVNQVIQNLEWFTWHRICDVPEATVDQWQINGEANTGQPVYNLNNIYRLQIPKGHDVWQISKQLEQLDGVLMAGPVPKPQAPPLPPNYQSMQGYLNPASSTPTGIDALYAWTQTGGTGTGVTVCDLEYSWNYNHADVTKAFGSQINTNVSDPFSNNDHGTAVIGELVSDNNGWGTTGICYGSGLKTCGTYFGIPATWNVPGAIAVAVANLNAGDVILLEQQWDYTGNAGYVPIEWWMNTSPSSQTYNAVYAAIVNAISNGIHVVEAGGNGSINTGTMTWYGDSGAIIVGAGGATSTNDLQKLSFSSYGPRFNLQGWGENVFTTGYGSYYSAMGVNYYYTSTFNGTSSASPIVAGAVACASGYYLANVSSTPPTPSYMRSHLATYGTPQVTPPSGNIGPRPNLYQAILNFPPPQQNYDWGDAPDPSYPTLAASNGAVHQISAVASVMLGYSIDPEQNGQPNPTATGDDNDGNDDEDGVLFTNVWRPGQTANITVIASIQGYLNAWVDFNNNGSWADPGEQIFAGQLLSAGPNLLSFNIPASAMIGNVFARFRFNTFTPALPFYGPAYDGEVEDYMVWIDEPAGDLDWGDAPDQPYPTLSANNGANHIIDGITFLGATVDPEPDGQPEPMALGDDNDIFYPPPNDDEDGVNMPAVVNTGATVNIVVIASVPGRLNAWLDFNMNGNWGDPGEQIFTNQVLTAGANNLSFVVPAGGPTGQSFARFRFSTQGGLSYKGQAPNGEVEDYVLFIEEGTDEFDWGDAPDQPYPTFAASNGANHLIDGVTYLGNQVDGEPDGQPDPNAMGDDNDILYPPPNDDEDGVNMPLLVNTGATVNIVVTASVQGRLNAWVDFNINGSWADPGEQIFTDQALSAGANNLSFTVPAGGPGGQSFARFRFDTQGGLSFTGTAPNGEVEDYELIIEEGPTFDYDWGDAPDQPYPTFAANNGANHKIDGVTYLGNQVDGEPDGQPDPNALGDDNDIAYPPPNDDEDGVTFNTSLIPGQQATVTVVASVSGYLNAWIDFNFNGTWADPGEQVFTDVLLAAGANILNFNVPATAGYGQTFARFRFASFTGLTFTGSADDGEVEDYEVYIIEEQPIDSDWGDAPDAPYPTLFMNNGASHVVDGITYLGNLVDIEPDGQPDPNALGDDNDILYPPPIDDEDGVTWLQPLVFNQPSSINVVASAPGFLNAWIDFNMNGSWADPGEQIFVDVNLVPGNNNLLFLVPPTSNIGQTFARFRFCTLQGLTFFGPAPDGEVEDYEVLIYEENPMDYEFGDAPEGSLGYPSLGVMGAFPTCRNVMISGWIQHTNFGAWLGPQFDMEIEGNAGNCPLFNPNMYDMDECFNDGDAGLLFPGSYTITGPAGSETVVPCAGSPVMPLGGPCQTMTWGANIDIDIHNHMPNGTIGYMNVLIDWDQNGQWGGSSSCVGAAAPEHVLVNFPVPNPFDGPLSALIPPNFLTGPNNGYFWARFSITEQQVPNNWDGSGSFEDGETEDYLLEVNAMMEDWGDAPDGPYPTFGANGGASHIIDGITFLGANVDADPDGQPDPNALGDDNDGNDDEDGVVISGPIAPGAGVTVQVTASVSGILNAWLDFNGNGSWGEATDHIFMDVPLTAGLNTLTFAVPLSGIATGQTFARFRFSSVTGLSYKYQAPDGEVEDYEVFIEEIDMGDANDPTYPTLLVNNGAAHVIDWVTYLGNYIDPEPDGQPDPNALGDDNDGGDDEDGVVFNSPLTPGASAAMTVTASATGFLNVWIDFNADGDWADSGEHVYSDQTLSAGSNLLFFPVPSSANVGTTYARFRFCTYQGLSYTGLAPNGEVEDYEVDIEGELDFGDAPDPTYPTLLASNGARHLIDYTVYLGNSIDPDGNGQPDPNALGDDNDGNDDEDGVTLPALLVPGQIANISVVASTTGFFNGWVDFNADGDWADANEQIFADVTLVPGNNNLSFSVPPSAVLGTTFARFRFCTFQGLTYTGQAHDGEVEDYEVSIDYQYKWIQHPDLTDLGMDVDATWDLGGFQPPHVLADDFLCDITGPLTNITVWGSWYHDHIPFMVDPNAVSFTLSIHEDIPAGVSGTGYSIPGNVLWFRTFNPGEFTATLFAANLNEGWFEPLSGYYEPNGDTQCWMYSFDLQPGEFIQEGTADIPKVYWLDVQAQPLDQDIECRFGWKTSVDHWNDNAVYGSGMEPYPGPWFELYHPVTGEQVDLAFAISGTEDPFILLDLTVLLEGPYNGTDMDVDLNSNNVIPLAQPYGTNSSAPWYYTGLETVASIPNTDVVDWIMIELRDATSPGGAVGSTMIAQKASFLLRGGRAVALDGSSYPKFYASITNNLYVVVYHRNHLGVMSANTIVPVGNLYSYDFTSGVSQAYGGANAHNDLGGGVYGMIGGDGKPDGQINNGDKNDVWATQAGTSGYKAGDFNMDVQVNNGDKIDIWVPNVGKGSQVP